MATFGVCSICALDHPLEEVARIARRCGADGVEVTARAPHLTDEMDLDAVRRAGDAVREAGVEVLAHGSYLACSPPAFRSDVEREVARCRALGARVLRVWAGHARGLAPEWRDEVVEMLRFLGEAAAEEELDVVIERHEGTFATEAAATLDLLEAVGRENVSLNYQVRDGMRADEVASLPSEIARLAPVSTYFHVKNYRPGPEPDAPMQLGGGIESGLLDYRDLVARAVAAGYTGPYVIEFLAFDDVPFEAKLEHDLAYLRTCWKEAEAT